MAGPSPAMTLREGEGVGFQTGCRTCPAVRTSPSLRSRRLVDLMAGLGPAIHAGADRRLNLTNCFRRDFATRMFPRGSAAPQSRPASTRLRCGRRLCSRRLDPPAMLTGKDAKTCQTGGNSTGVRTATHGSSRASRRMAAHSSFISQTLHRAAGFPYRSGDVPEQQRERTRASSAVPPDWDARRHSALCRPRPCGRGSPLT